MKCDHSIIRSNEGVGDSVAAYQWRTAQPSRPTHERSGIERWISEDKTKFSSL